MNKKLLAVAIGSALASAPMFANAAATLYGAVHLSIDNYENDATANNKLLTMSSNSSFVGIKADEDLGGGLKGIMGAEWQMSFDAAANGIANRNVFVGLAGGFGSIKLGQMDDIVKNVGRKVDMFHNEQIGESRSMVRQNGFGVDMDARMANSVRYDSPKLGPVTISAQYGMANDADETLGQDGTQMALGAELNMGGLYAGVAWKQVAIDVGATTEDATGLRGVVSYAFPFGLKIAGLYQTIDNTTGGGNVDLQTYGVGVSFKVGNGVIKGQYYSAGESASGAENGGTLTAIGYDHMLSKNTMVYAVYGTTSNDLNGAYSVIGAGHSNPNDSDWNNTTAALADGGDKAISIGMKMKF